MHARPSVAATYYLLSLLGQRVEVYVCLYCMYMLDVCMHVCVIVCSMQYLDVLLLHTKAYCGNVLPRGCRCVDVSMCRCVYVSMSDVARRHLAPRRTRIPACFTGTHTCTSTYVQGDIFNMQ
jgi:hypothetical protein